MIGHQGNEKWQQGGQCGDPNPAAKPARVTPEQSDARGMEETEQHFDRGLMTTANPQIDPKLRKGQVQRIVGMIPSAGRILEIRCWEESAREEGVTCLGFPKQ